MSFHTKYLCCYFKVIWGSDIEFYRQAGLKFLARSSVAVFGITLPWCKTYLVLRFNVSLFLQDLTKILSRRTWMKYVFIYSWVGVRLCLSILRPERRAIVLAPDDWWENSNTGRTRIGSGILKYVQREIFHSANFVHHKYYMEYLGMNLELRGEMSETKRLSYGRTHEIRLQADL
jgi:hypothetical protein